MAGSSRGLTLFPLPTPSTFIIWEKARSGLYHWKVSGRFLQCLMEHSENHSNVSSSWWHPIAPKTRENTQRNAIAVCEWTLELHNSMEIRETKPSLVIWAHSEEPDWKLCWRQRVLWYRYAAGLGYRILKNKKKEKKNACTSSTVNLLSQSQ